MGKAEYGEWPPDELDDLTSTARGRKARAGRRYKLSAPQFEVFSDPARFKWLCAGRRFGKTYLELVTLVGMADAPDKLAWYIAPTYRQAKEIAWRQLCTMYQPYIAKKNESELSVEFTWGGRVALKGGEKYDSLRGPGLDGVVFDEAADISKFAWSEVIRPMLADRLGKALFGGTPKGFNWFYEEWLKAKGQPDSAAFQFTTLEGGNVSATEVEAARNDLDPKTFEQEFNASFENIGSGRIYYSFDRLHNVAPLDYDPRLPLCWSLDFNVNPMTSELFQIVGDEMHVIDELSLPDSNTYQACDVFLRRASELLSGNSQLIVYGDSTGKNRMHSGESDWGIVREKLANLRGVGVDVSYRVPTNNPAIKDRYAAVNGMLSTSSGRRRLLVDPKCKELIADCERCLYKEDSQGRNTGEIDTRDPKRTHASDAIGYPAYYEFGHYQKGGFGTDYLGA